MSGQGSVALGRALGAQNQVIVKVVIFGSLRVKHRQHYIQAKINHQTAQD
jgi:hypothetical protein